MERQPDQKSLSPSLGKEVMSPIGLAGVTSQRPDKDLDGGLTYLPQLNVASRTPQCYGSLFMQRRRKRVQHPRPSKQTHIKTRHSLPAAVMGLAEEEKLKWFITADPLSSHRPVHSQYSRQTSAMFTPANRQDCCHLLPCSHHQTDKTAAMFTPPNRQTAAMFTPPNRQTAAMFTPPNRQTAAMFTPPNRQTAAMFTPPNRQTAAMFTPPNRQTAAMFTPPNRQTAAMFTPPNRQDCCHVHTTKQTRLLPCSHHQTDRLLPCSHHQTDKTAAMFTPPNRQTAAMFTPPNRQDCCHVHTTKQTDFCHVHTSKQTRLLPWTAVSTVMRKRRIWKPFLCLSLSLSFLLLAGTLTTQSAAHSKVAKRLRRGTKNRWLKLHCVGEHRTLSAVACGRE
ncbi:UNVERIFIED_CONTAM: hypothetical protein FKN15_039530 [Acipenser sinensis]